jgi:hypothetical protein
MRLLMLFTFALILTFTKIGTINAEPYPSEILNKLMLAQWHRIVPAEYSRNAWISNLQGTETPVKIVNIREKNFYLGVVCKPHACDTNIVVFLIAVDGSEAYGLLTASTLAIRHHYLGEPGSAARVLLDQEISD